MINGLLVLMAFQYLNVPYKWGGNNVDGLDCSGLVVRVLQDLKLIGMGEDYTAQGLYNWCKEQPGGISSTACNSLLFFGRNRNEIRHVAISMGQYNSRLVMIEAGGAGRESLTTDRATLIRRNARVRIMPVSNRRDFIEGVLIPFNKGV
jgi:cell wall-associated NlpC family hydrolase